MDGQSHVVHSEPEALGTRLTIDSLTCLLANETDPSKLITASPGKLMRKFIEDGGHINKDQPYAEIEVRCKTCIQLTKVAAPSVCRRLKDEPPGLRHCPIEYFTSS